MIFIKKKNKKKPIKINLAKTDEWTGKEFIMNIDMNSHAKSAIVKELKFRLRLLTPYRLLKLEYFFTYALNPNKIKIPNCLYIRCGSRKPFVKITKHEMFTSNASSKEYEEFLEKLGSTKVTNTKEILEKMRL